MFLKSIRIQNVRCLEDVEMSFETDNPKKNRKWTILVGDNGSGKSTVLKAIGLLMAGSEGLMDLLDSPDHWVRNGCDSCTISGVLTTARGEEREISLTLRRGQSKRELLAENAKPLKRLDDALEHTDRSYLTLGYGGSRHSNDSGYGGAGADVYFHPRARGCATLFAEHAQMMSFELWAMDFHSRNADAGIRIIREALEGLLPNVTFHDFHPRRRQMLFKTPDGLVPLRHLSSGYRSVAGFCGDLLYRITEIFKDYKKKGPLKARGLLLVDELGLHLHPVWQRTLVEFLTHKMPNFQLVVTTNSPLLAHQAGEDELFYLLREDRTAPPALHHFEGSPNKLLLHQLIMSPVFGVDTANSHPVERRREEHRKLGRKAKKTARDKRRIKELEETLGDVTQWDEVTEGDRRMSSLLSRIEEKLSKE